MKALPNLPYSAFDSARRLGDYGRSDAFQLDSSPLSRESQGSPVSKLSQSARSGAAAFPIHADIMLSFEVLYQVVFDDTQQCLPDNEAESIL